MLPRHAPSDAASDRIQDRLPGRPAQAGWLAQDNRRFVDAVLRVAKAGAPWRDLPERFGNWNSVWRRFDRGAKRGAWRRLLEALRGPDLEWLILDPTIIKGYDSKKLARAIRARGAEAVIPSLPTRKGQRA